MPSCEDLYTGGYFDLDSGVGPLVVGTQVSLTEGYQFDADSRARSNSGSDGIFMMDTKEIPPSIRLSALAAFDRSSSELAQRGEKFKEIREGQ